MQNSTHLILASASEGRRDLMRRAGYEFDVIPSGVDEPDWRQFGEPQTYVEHVAWLKAAAVAPKVPSGIVLAADSVGWHDGEVIGKPADEPDARRILERLAGTRHELWTGVCLWLRPSDLQLSWQERSVVEMKALAAGDLDTYLATGIWQGKSGAYAIQEEGDPFIRVIAGTVSNVVGLPLETLAQVLKWLESSPTAGLGR
jgi:septum formation protein